MHHVQMNPRIAVIGQGSGSLKSDISKKAIEIGRILAKEYCILITGACNGYPYEATKGSYAEKGETIGISPAVNEDEHREQYEFPTECFTRIEYTGEGIPKRNMQIIERADAIIMIGGKIGTLNEFTLAFHKGKVIGVLENSGGITSIIKDISEICNKKDEKEKVIISSSPKDLVQQVLVKIREY